MGPNCLIGMRMKPFSCCSTLFYIFYLALYDLLYHISADHINLLQSSSIPLLVICNFPFFCSILIVYRPVFVVSCGFIIVIAFYYFACVSCGRSMSVRSFLRFLMSNDTEGNNSIHSECQVGNQVYIYIHNLR